MTGIPLFLDVEASSFSPTSYPIEIAWSDELGNIESHLINPYLYTSSYTDWDPGAQAVHGLSRAYLMQHGRSPLIVAQRMHASMHGRRYYTDAPEFDGFWIKRLFEATGMVYQVDLGNMEVYLQNILPMEYWLPSTSDGIKPISQLYKSAREQCGYPAHRAANDVAYLIELNKQAKRLAGYYK